MVDVMRVGTWCLLMISLWMGVCPGFAPWGGMDCSHLHLLFYSLV
nr:MAG TPA: hypothetical protein [Bacteriophage sp.]